MWTLPGSMADLATMTLTGSRAVRGAAAGVSSPSRAERGVSMGVWSFLAGLAATRREPAGRGKTVRLSGHVDQERPFGPALVDGPDGPIHLAHQGVLRPDMERDLVQARRIQAELLLQAPGQVAVREMVMDPC